VNIETSLKKRSNRERRQTNTKQTTKQVTAKKPAKIVWFMAISNP
jgi:hypothetical protein